MDDGLTGLIGLARKAGKAEVGEESVAAAATAHKSRLILLSSDAAENTAKRAHRLGESGNCPVVTLPLSKAELGAALGRGSCAVMALTDVGLAAGVMKKLSARDPEAYAGVTQHMEHKAEKTLRRRKAQRQKEKAAQARGRKPWAAPPK